MFYHDSEHTYKMMKWEYETVYQYMNKPSIICSDDVNWNLAFQDFCGTYGLTPNLISERAGYALVPKRY